VRLALRFRFGCADFTGQSFHSIGRLQEKFEASCLSVGYEKLLRHRMVGTQLTVDLMYDTEEWAETFSKDPPEIKIIEESGAAGGRSVRDLQWKRIAPGHFSLAYELEEGAVVRGAVRVGSQAVPFGPLVVGASAEWAFDSDRVSELRQVAVQTSGRELLDLSDAWLRPELERSSDLRASFVIVLLVVLLIDALITRIGWSMPKFELSALKSIKLPKRAKASGRPKQVPASGVIAATKSEPNKPPTKDEPKSDPVKPTAPQRRTRYNRAKR